MIPGVQKTFVLVVAGAGIDGKEASFLILRNEKGFGLEVESRAHFPTLLALVLHHSTIPFVSPEHGRSILLVMEEKDTNFPNVLRFSGGRSRAVSMNSSRQSIQSDASDGTIEDAAIGTIDFESPLRF